MGTSLKFPKNLKIPSNKKLLVSYEDTQNTTSNHFFSRVRCEVIKVFIALIGFYYIFS